MTTMNAELYAALISAGAPEEKASLAARSVLESDARLHRLATDASILNWMMGALITIGVSAVPLIVKGYLWH